MNAPPVDYQHHALLFVDDEAKSRKYFRRLYGGTFRILEAADGVEALRVFRAHAAEIGVIVTDQRMPNETGSGFLAKVAASHPGVVKILSTAYSDLDAAIDAVNRGGIYRYITKPWDVSELEVTLRRAMELFVMKRERDRIVETKVTTLVERVRASRLASFALAPVVAGLPVRRAAEAVAAVVRLGAAGGPLEGDRAGDLRAIHRSQLDQAARLELRLREGFAGGGLTGRVDNFARLLPSAVVTADGAGFRVTTGGDPFPRLLRGLLGMGGPDGAPLLAAILGIYDAGGALDRAAGEADGFRVLAGWPSEDDAPGLEVVRWIFDDDLISAALGFSDGGESGLPDDGE